MNSQNFANRQFFTAKPKKEQKPCYFAVGEVLDSPQAKVFVSGITKLISDEILKKIFEQCGEIFKWKRTEGADGTLQPFLFCEYVDAQSSVKAVKFLNNFKLGDRRLIVKMDDKTKKNIIEYLRNSQKPDDLKPIKINEDGLPIFDNDRKSREEVEDNVVAIIRGHYPEFIKMPLAEDNENNKDDANEDIGREKREGSVCREESEMSGRESALSNSKKESEHRHGYDSSSSESNQSSPASSYRKSKDNNRHSRSTSRKREIEDSDEEYEKRKLKQIMKEKEEEYQKRLRRWEEREERQAKAYKAEEKFNIESSKKKKKTISKMLRFLEDYDDEKDDDKYYNVHIMNRIRREYDKQKDADLKDKEREEREIKELRKIALSHSKTTNDSTTISDDDMEVDNHEEKSSKNLVVEQVTPDSRASPSNVSCENNDNSALSDNGEKKPAICLNLNVNNKRVQNEAFDIADDEDDDEPKLEIKKKLKIFEVTHEERMQTMTVEEKEVLIKSIVNNIPKDKEELFKTPVLWELIDKDIIEKKIKPYVDSKIQEYLGDKEESLTAFILEKITNQSKPDDLLNDIKLVLEEDAEVFTIKLWRLIIYEIEAKKIGII
uniref:PWI domain-containing protein n=2 Tax=Strongyloides stercoralis TaxID=6248 RepID=A0A913HTD2_STRER